MPIHSLSSSFPSIRQGLHHSSCSAQCWHRKIFTWEPSPFIPAELLLNQNKRCHYSQACPQHTLSSTFSPFRRSGPHHHSEVSRRTTNFNSSIQAGECTKSITHSALLGRSKASHRLVTTYVFTSGKQGLALSKHALIPHGWEMRGPQSDLLSGSSALKWE